MKVCFQDFPHIPCLWHYKEKSPFFISGLVKRSMAGGTVLGKQQCSAHLAVGVCIRCGLYLLLCIRYAAPSGHQFYCGSRSPHIPQDMLRFQVFPLT